MEVFKKVGHALGSCLSVRGGILGNSGKSEAKCWSETRPKKKTGMLQGTVLTFQFSSISLIIVYAYIPNHQVYHFSKSIYLFNLFFNQQIQKWLMCVSKMYGGEIIQESVSVEILL